MFEDPEDIQLPAERLGARSLQHEWAQCTKAACGSCSFCTTSLIYPHNFLLNQK
jgi:hypothetical protein